ncbi:MAG: transposase [Bradyrhizobium sp.]
MRQRTRRWGNGPLGPAGGRPSHDGVTESRIDLAPSIKETTTDRSGRISKIGDASVRAALYEAAHIMLTKSIKGCSRLKSWAMRIARRAGMKKAKVALARKLAVILHRMLVTATPFNDAAAAA